jgi:hypothetical protein
LRIAWHNLPVLSSGEVWLIPHASRRQMPAHRMMKNLTAPTGKMFIPDANLFIRSRNASIPFRNAMILGRNIYVPSGNVKMIGWNKLVPARSKGVPLHFIGKIIGNR